MSRPSLLRLLSARLVWVALAAILVNAAAVSIPYLDRRLLEAEVVELRVLAFERALRAAPPGRPGLGPEDLRLYEAHPDAYAYALLDAGGAVIEAAIPGLIPPDALRVGGYARDWVTRGDGRDAPLLVTSHEAALPEGPLRAVFVMQADPAGLMRRALLVEFRDHVLLPLVPSALVLVLARALLVRGRLAPVARAAAWARAVRPGRPVPPFPDGPLPAEVADLTDATRRALDRLQAALAAETRRAAEAAHAVRTPVAVLTARLDGLPPSPEALRLRADVAALSRMVTQLLASSRAEMLEEADEVVDLAALAEDVAAEVAPFAIARGGGVELHPPAGRPLARGAADPIRLALRNLVENAVIHGGGRVEVAAGPGPVLAVRDHGPGLPSDREAIFRPFWRAPGAAEGGAGLGLAVVARTQAAMGGTVETVDAPGGGAEVRLLFRPA